MKKPGEISRRTFLKGMAAGAIGTAVHGTFAAFADDTASSTSAESSALPGSQSYDIINCDVLIIGSGNNALFAADTAISEGRIVTFVDKGPYRQSGVTGMSWDYFLGQNHSVPIKALADTSVLENAEAYTRAWEFIDKKNKHNRFVYEVNHGQTLPDRDENGHYIPFLTEDRTQGQFLRRHKDFALVKSNVNVVDQTMITDILINDGRCVGAMGLHLPTGDFKIFRANAVIMATGGCTNIYGWRGVSSVTNSVTDNTADLDMAAFRHGARIINSEFANYDVMSVYPEGLSTAFGAAVCGDAQEPQCILDKDGELLFDLNDERIWTDRSFFCRFMAEQIDVHGRGTENHTIYINLGNYEPRYGNARNIPLLAKFGVDVRSEMIEGEPEMFEHGGSPICDAKMMTDFPGLFCGRNYRSGSGIMNNYYTGTYAGHCAAEYAKNNPVSEIDFSPALEEYKRLHEIRTRSCEDSVRPHEVRLAIQEAGYKALGPYRTTKSMEESLAQLEYVRQEMIPKMVPADTSQVFNIEWKHAIENYNLLDLAEMSVRASLMREETRDAYVRGEFPQIDDENWSCVIACSIDGDQMKLEKATYEDFNKMREG